MTLKQFSQIKEFAKPFYNNSGKWHDWDHIKAVRKHARKLARREKDINIKVLEAACYLHDIGRSVKDEGHSGESVKIALPFLKKIGVSSLEVEMVSDAIFSHERSAILDSRTKEARVLFDADKLEILSVYGFIRVCFFLVEEREMDLKRAVNFLWEYVVSVKEKYLYTELAKKTIEEDLEILDKFVRRFNEWTKRMK